jgi:hypothetical protein
MKYLFPVALLFCIISACNNSSDQPALTDDTVISVTPRFTWQVSLNDTSGKLEMKKIVMEEEGEISPEGVIEPINQMYPEIQLDYVVTSNDTVYLNIEDAHYLTQQMGSAGSSVYLATVVYNITELPHIHYVNITFPEGDHAQPGTFTRNNFENQ